MTAKKPRRPTLRSLTADVRTLQAQQEVTGDLFKDLFTRVAALESRPPAQPAAQPAPVAEALRAMQTVAENQRRFDNNEPPLPDPAPPPVDTPMQTAGEQHRQIAAELDLMDAEKNGGVLTTPLCRECEPCESAHGVTGPTGYVGIERCSRCKKPFRVYVTREDAPPPAEPDPPGGVRLSNHFRPVTDPTTGERIYERIAAPPPAEARADGGCHVPSCPIHRPDEARPAEGPPGSVMPVYLVTLNGDWYLCRRTRSEAERAIADLDTPGTTIEEYVPRSLLTAAEQRAEKAEAELKRLREAAGRSLAAWNPLAGSAENLAREALRAALKGEG